MSDEVKTLCGLTVHPAAAVLPLVDGAEFEELKESIRKHGLRQPVVVHNGTVIDGRNRLLAWQAIHEHGDGGRADAPPPPQVEWQPSDGETVADFVISANIHRRHLTPSQRAAAAVLLAELVEKESAERAKASQFKPGNKAAAKKSRTKEAKPRNRDHKAEAERSTNGRLAKQCGASVSQVKKAKGVRKRERAGELPEGTLQGVADGTIEMRDIAVEPEHAATNEDEYGHFDEVVEMRALVQKQWVKFKEKFAHAELGLVRRLVLEIVKQERRDFKE